jgi:hypothetical protein
VLAARQQCKKRGEWKPWCEKTGLSKEQAARYTRFGERCRDDTFLALSEDEQWAEWQRISGNAAPAEDEDAAAGSDEDDSGADEAATCGEVGEHEGRRRLRQPVRGWQRIN